MRKVFPDRIVIEVKERRPLATVQLDELCYIDRKGVIFSKVGDRDGYNYPFLTGVSRSSLEKEAEGRRLLAKALELLRVIGRGGRNPRWRRSPKFIWTGTWASTASAGPRAWKSGSGGASSTLSWPGSFRSGRTSRTGGSPLPRSTAAESKADGRPARGPAARPGGPERRQGGDAAPSDGVGCGPRRPHRFGGWPVKITTPPTPSLRLAQARGTGPVGGPGKKKALKKRDSVERR